MLDSAAASAELHRRSDGAFGLGAKPKPKPKAKLDMQEAWSILLKGDTGREYRLPPSGHNGWPKKNVGEQ